MARLTIALAALLSAACADRGYDYTLTLDTSLSDEQAALVRAAAQSWRDAIPELHIQTVHGHCETGKLESVANDNFCVAVSDGSVPGHPEAFGEETDGLDSGSVVIYPDQIAAAYPDNVDLIFQCTATHEVGHALGLKHDRAGTIMAATMEAASDCAGGGRVSAGDIAQFNRTR